MAMTSFRNEALTWLREQFGDAYAREVPETPPDWYARQFSNRALPERNWSIFRGRLAGMSAGTLAHRYGMHEPEVHQVSYAVLMALIQSRGSSPGRPPVRPKTVPRIVVPPTSALVRDCLLVNKRLATRPRMPRLQVEHLLQVGIDANTTLARVPDELLLVARGVGPRLLAEIRRQFPFDPDR